MNIRKATNTDAAIVYEWANDILTRQNSYNPEPIQFAEHVKWFERKLADEQCAFYIFSNEEDELTGTVRIDEETESNSIIGITVAPFFRGKGLASEMIKLACEKYSETRPDKKILAYVFKTNEISAKSFLRAGFIKKEEVIVKGIDSILLIKEN